MKKRLIGLVTLLMSLGVAGCFGNNTTTPEEKEGYTATEKGHYKFENGKKGDLEPHTYVPYAGDDKHVPEVATCDKAGKSFEICEVCKRINTISSKPLDHELIDNGSTATCESDGILSQKCANCNYKKTENVKALGHDWGTVTAVNAKVGKATCGRSNCGKTEYVIDVKTGGFELASGSAWKNDPSSGEMKLSKDGYSFSFTFNLPKGFVGKMYQRGYMDSYSANSSKKVYYQTNNESNINVTINNQAVDMSDDYFKNLVFSDVYGEELDGSNSTVKDILIGEVNLGTENTITFKRVQTLNIIVSSFVFVGAEA